MTESVGEALVGLLEAYGVRTVFGIPGVHNVEMYRALPRSRITHVLARHEQGAGFMADGFARATGRPGVAFTITGPGLTNILTPMGQAWSDSVPLLVLSSALDLRDGAQGRGRLHEMRDQRAAATSVAALAMRAEAAQDVPDAVARAFAAFAAERPRPAYLELPLDLLKEPATGDWTPRALPAPGLPAPAALDAAAAFLRAARTPVLLLGGGALHAGAEALRLAAALGAPVLTTTAGKGAVRADAPGVWGNRLQTAEGRALLLGADAIVAAGTELAETDFWDLSFRLPATLVRIDLDTGALARPHPARHALPGDAALALAALADRVAPRAALAPQAPDWPPGDALRAMLGRVLATIREALPEETVIASDMTQIAYAANEIFPVFQPRTWLHPVGFGTLGYALPAAIGARVGRPDRPVAVLAGDYGFQYTLPELGTAAEHGLPLIILLWNNDALAQIRDDMVGKGIQPNAVTLRNPDFPALAAAYGIRAERPGSLAALARAIACALSARGPTLIEMTPAMAGR